MCMCGKPTVNGEPGYSWDGKNVGVRKPDPPELSQHDELVYDLPGRCGGVDSHCHHFRLVKQFSTHYLLVRHGGGDERIRLHCMAARVLAALDDTNRYWMLQTLYHSQSDAARSAREKANASWTRAAAEKRIKTRKTTKGVKVWLA